MGINQKIARNPEQSIFWIESNAPDARTHSGERRELAKVRRQVNRLER
jgi:hypothetical protein